jgi:hypothetical protein
VFPNSIKFVPFFYPLLLNQVATVLFCKQIILQLFLNARKVIKTFLFTTEPAATSTVRRTPPTHVAQLHTSSHDTIHRWRDISASPQRRLQLAARSVRKKHDAITPHPHNGHRSNRDQSREVSRCVANAPTQLVGIGQRAAGAWRWRAGPLHVFFGWGISFHFFSDTLLT